MEPWPDEVATDAVLRIGTRVLLVDEEERLLLLRYVDNGKYIWVPVGGGVEPGETIEQTARREIVEETGFLARVPHADIDRSGWTPLEHATITAYRWWTVAELAATSEWVVPRDLARLLSELLLHGPPASPLELGL